MQEGMLPNGLSHVDYVTTFPAEEDILYWQNIDDTLSPHQSQISQFVAGSLQRHKEDDG